MVLVHENHDKRPNVLPVQHVCTGFDQANLVSSFHGSKCLTNIKFSNVYFFSNMSILNVLCKKMIIFSPIGARLRIGHIFRTGDDSIGAFCRFALAEKRIPQHIFCLFVIFYLLKCKYII